MYTLLKLIVQIVLVFQLCFAGRAYHTDLRQRIIYQALYRRFPIQFVANINRVTVKTVKNYISRVTLTGDVLSISEMGHDLRGRPRLISRDNLEELCSITVSNLT